MPEWLQRAIFYEIYPQSFCDGNGDGIGDIRGMRSKLGYIRDLGADAIWLNPIFDSPFMDAGYDVRDYTKVAPRYGTNEELIEFFAEAHRVGIRVLLDLVPGHTSNEHPWFLQSSSASPNEMSGRYIWTDSVWEAPPQYKFVCGMFERDGNSMVNFFSSQPALNYGFREITHPWQCPPDHADALATREAIKDVMRFWLNAGCDGFRVDMADSLIKNDEDKTATSVVWQDIRAMLDRDYPDAALISEWSCPQRAIPAGFHADFYLDHVGKGYHRVFRAVDSVTRKPQGYFAREGRNGFRQFAAEFMEDYLAVHEKGYISLISGNHDTPRLAKFLSPEERKLAFFFLLTMPGVPFIYYGDEVGMRYVEGLPSKEGGYQRTGSRTPMQWDDTVNRGFSTAPGDQLYLPVDPDPQSPDVRSAEADPESLLWTVRRVAALRRQEPELQSNKDFAFLTWPAHGEPLVFRRGSLYIAIHPGESPADVILPHSAEQIFVLGQDPVIDRDKVRLAPGSAVVLRQVV